MSDPEEVKLVDEEMVFLPELLEELKPGDDEGKVIHPLVEEDFPVSNEPLEELKRVDDEEKVIHPLVEEDLPVSNEPLEELKPVDDEEKVIHSLVEEGSPVSKEPLQELKPVDDGENVIHPLVEKDSPVSKEFQGYIQPLEELKFVDDEETLVEEECPVSKEELKCDQKPPFTFEWVEVSSDTPESVTGAEYPVVEEEFPVIKEVLDCDLEPLLTPELEKENLDFTSESDNEVADPDSIEYYTFSEANLHFSTIMLRSHLEPKYSLVIPRKVSHELPQMKVPAVLNLYGKCWTMFYNGHHKLTAFDKGWKLFAYDNELKLGDCCFFEITENSKTRIVFKVVILRTASSPCADGDTVEEPIVVD